MKNSFGLFTNFYPRSKRTLGVITKPDRLDPGSGSEAKFLELARNEDVFFRLGWHVVKNRAFAEHDFSMEERNASEDQFFTTSNFRVLPAENLGIDALRVRLSHLLLEHVKSELPRLKSELKNALNTARSSLKALGKPRSSLAECRTFLAEVNMGCYELCKAALGGHYEHDYFRPTKSKTDVGDNNENPPPNRLKAVVQDLNSEFSHVLRRCGHKYQITLAEAEDTESVADAETVPSTWPFRPTVLSKDASLDWAMEILRRCRGTELVGNFNPNLIAELFWEQSEHWEGVTKAHIQVVHKSCDQFLRGLLTARAPPDMRPKLW